MGKKFKWVVELEVDETWVADGFDLTQRRADLLAQHILPHAYSFEVGMRVLEAPRDEEIAKAQGYKSVREFLKDRHG